MQKFNTSFLSTYRSAVGQTTTNEILPEQYVKNYHRESTKTRSKGSTSSSRFERKLEMNNFDKFTCSDLAYYFKHVAMRVGVRYSIASVPKESAMFKNLLKDYSASEICTMIDFVFESEQTYLDRSKLSPNILVSRWRNTIYPDSQAWIRGEFTQEKSKSQTKLQKREWGKTKTDNVASVGEWD